MLYPMPCCMYIESTTIAAFYAYALTLCYTVSRLFKAVALKSRNYVEVDGSSRSRAPLKTPRLQCSRSVRSIFFYSVFLDSPHSVQLSCLLLVWWQGEHNFYSVTRVGLLVSRRIFPSHQPFIQIDGRKNVHDIQVQFDFKKIC